MPAGTSTGWALDSVKWKQTGKRAHKEVLSVEIRRLWNVIPCGVDDPARIVTKKYWSGAVAVNVTVAVWNWPKLVKFVKARISCSLVPLINTSLGVVAPGRAKGA